MNLIVKYSLILLLIIATSQCGKKNVQLEAIKQKYTVEELNYFYELAFYDETTQSHHSIEKKVKDVFIYIEGANREDSITILKLIKELNEMCLPVKFYTSKYSKMANMKVYFGNFEYLNNLFPGHFASKNARGIGSGDRCKSSIGIIDSLERHQKDLVIKEEIIQSLGLSSDSWTYPESLFFQDNNSLISFSSMDKRMLQLLYEDYFTTNYSINDYECDFEDVLYAQNSACKISQYVKQSNIPINYIDSIRLFAPNEVYYKYPNKIMLVLKGEYTNDDMLFCKNMVESFNHVLSPKLELIWSADTAYLPAINICYSPPSTHQEEHNATIVYFRDSLSFVYTLSSEINVLSPQIQNQQTKNEVILLSIYRILGLNLHPYDAMFDVSDGECVMFKSVYLKILSLFYEPIFYSGIKVSEIDKAIELLKQPK